MFTFNFIKIHLSIIPINFNKYKKVNTLVILKDNYNFFQTKATLLSNFIVIIIFEFKIFLKI